MGMKIKLKSHPIPSPFPPSRLGGSHFFYYQRSSKLEPKNIIEIFGGFYIYIYIYLGYN
jgi:hypothetical protein